MTIMRGPLPSISFHTVFERLLRWGLAVAFLWAAILKLSAPRAFAATVSRFHLVPAPLLPVVAIGLPLLEVLAAAGLLTRRRWGLRLTVLLLLLFVAILGYGIGLDLEIDCGCFSQEEQAEQGSLRSAFLRDLGMLAACAWLWWRERIERRTTSAPQGGGNHIQQEQSP